MLPPWKIPTAFLEPLFAATAELENEEEEFSANGGTPLDPLLAPDLRSVNPTDDHTFARIQHTYAAGIHHLDDALGRVLAAVHDQGGDYLLGLKGNQGALLEEVEYFFRIARAEHWHCVPYGYHETLEKDHGRVETRRIWCVSALDWLPQQSAPPKNASRVITPHPGEAGRLLKMTAGQIQANRPEALRELSKLFGNCLVVLKGHQTLIGRSSGEIFVNSSGNPHLAQGGAGDVLAGLLSTSN